jgi:predicted enzyme related to lactoylglutathione lyase
MGERTQYTPGTFCWADLTTSDQEAAKTFYSELFGWEAQDTPMDGGATYSMMQKEGKRVAAIAPQPPPQRDAGAPSVWNSYISVENADASAQRAQELGATVHAPAFDVGEAGRMAVLQDPQGAYVMVWQPRGNIGAALVNAPGALVWNELASSDLEASQAFYSQLFDWQIAPFENSPTPYLAIRNGDANNGGMRDVTPPGTPPHWLVYFGVEDVAQALAKAQELGATKLAGPIDIQMAKIAVIQDPQGAVLALYAGMLEP